MKEIFNLNKYISIIVISLQSNIGTAILILFLVLVDAVGSAFGVASIFRQRFIELNADTAFKMSLVVGGVFAFVNLVGIVITSLKKSMAGVNNFLTFISAFLSFVGFVKFIIPNNFTINAINFDIGLSLLIAFCLALVPAVVVKFASEDLTSDKSNNEEVKKLTQDMTKQASRILREQFESLGSKASNTNSKIIKLNKVA